MENLKMREPMIAPTQNDPNLKVYRCPHCHKFLFKGNIQRLHMVCHHCQVMIHADEIEYIALC